MVLTYFVVFEHTEKTGGYTGIRFYVSYQNADDFQKHSRADKNDVFRVMAENVTKDQAQDIVSCTPEICRLTAIIEEAFGKQKNQFDFKILREKFSNTVYTIGEDRFWRYDHHLKLYPVTSIYKPDGGSTLKDRILSAVINVFSDPCGYIGDLCLVGEIFFSTVISTH